MDMEKFTGNGMSVIKTVAEVQKEALPDSLRKFALFAGVYSRSLSVKFRKRLYPTVFANSQIRNLRKLQPYKLDTFDTKVLLQLLFYGVGGDIEIREQ